MQVIQQGHFIPNSGSYLFIQTTENITCSAAIPLSKGFTVYYLDIDSLAEAYNTGLGDILNKHAPIVKREVKDRASSEWMTTDSQECRRVLRRAERKYRKQA